MSPLTGMVEMIPNSETLRKIQVEHGVTGSFKDRPLADWLQKHNPGEDAYEKVGLERGVRLGWGARGLVPCRVPPRPACAQRRRLSCAGREETLGGLVPPSEGVTCLMSAARAHPLVSSWEAFPGSSGRLGLEEGAPCQPWVLSTSSCAFGGVQWCFAE